LGSIPLPPTVEQNRSDLEQPERTIRPSLVLEKLFQVTIGS
jgi:hypothetical protein